MTKNNDIHSINESANQDSEYNRLIYELIKQIPKNDLEKVESLKQVVWYLGAILYGDGIHSFSAVNYHSEYVKEAISKLVKYAQLNSIENYGAIIDNLRQELTELHCQKTVLSESVSALEKENSELSEQIAKLQKQKEEIESYKTDLSAEIKELETGVANYERIINYGDEPCVIWEPISESHPIYGLSRNNISLYIQSLIKEYSVKMAIDYEKSKQVLMAQNSALFSLQEYLISTFTKEENHTIRWFLDSNYYSKKHKIAIECMLKDMRTYRIVNNGEIKTNEASQDALEKLRMQKKLLEALSKQKIAEKQLEMVISALSENTPSQDILNSISEMKGL